MNKQPLTIYALVLFTLIGAALFVPLRPVLAVPAEITADAPMMQDKLITSAKKKMMDSTNYAITQALVTAVNTAAQRVAAATATWVASGDIGQGPLIFSKEFGPWGQGLFLDTISDALNNFTKTAWGFGICEPINPSVSLRIKLGIARTYVPKPACSFSKFSAALDGTWTNIESGKLLQNISASVEMGQSPLSFALTTQFGASELAANKTLAKQQERLSTNGFKNLTAPISGDTKTPAQMIEHATRAQIDNANSQDKMTATVYLNKTDLLASVGANALRVFTSTLAGKLLDKYLKKGMITGADVVCKTAAGSAFDICKGTVDEGLAAGTSEGASGGAALAATYFATVFPPSVNVVDDYSPLSELTTCPGAESRGVWNCVMDQEFMNALSPAENGFISVRDAINKKLLHGEWELVPETDSRNGEYDCYTKAYCYTNLVKMRRMRIIPVGWEMAAMADSGSSGSNKITLQGAIDGFANPSSPYYHLVDPDWILKVPVTQCRQMVNGETLVTPDTPERASVCVDAPSCISEDADGKCTGGLGYCTRERSVWQIDATSCPKQYASCNAFSDPSGKSLSVLTNTVDASACNAQNVGCRTYASVGGMNGWVEGAGSVYLNAKGVACEESGAGCRSLMQMKSASSANLLPNPGFETPTTDGAMAESWTKDWESAGPSQYLRDGISAYEGLSAYVNRSALSIGGYHNLNGTVDVKIAPNQLYTLSFYARSAGSGSQNGNMELKLFDRPFISGTLEACPAYAGIDNDPKPSCVQDISLSAYVPTCTTTAATAISNCRTAPGGDYGPENANGEIDMTFPLTGGYERYTVTFATPENAHYIGLYFPVSGAPYYIDAFQLEIGATATPYHVGGTDSTGASVAIKTPPAYLGCTGEATADAGKGCDAYAKVCRQSEVGCTKYTPTDGGTPVTAVTSSGDVCSAECVGYNTFKEEASRWSSPRFPLYFIPSTAKSCQLSEVGCSEFTNLEAISVGGESKSYFTYVRSCRMPDAPNDGTFFVWEGSDVSGFQLKSYTLRIRDDGTNSMFSVANQADNYVQNPDPGVPGNPNGPAYLTGTNPAECTRAIYAAKTNPDCRELLDKDSNIFYRLLSATITSTGDCKVFRKTLSTQTDCTNSGGVWSGGANSCDYYTYVAQSTSCRAEVNGCRAYTGNKGNNTRIIVSSGFENDQIDGWTGGVPSNESVAVGGRSYSANRMAKALADSSGQPLLKTGHSYTLTVWAKGQGDLISYFEGRGITTSDHRSRNFTDSAGSNASIIKLSSEWQRFVLGPVIMEWPANADDQLVIGAMNSSTSSYFDNIELTETQEIFPLVQNSWKTPAVCDQTSAGQYLPQAQLGCSSFTNSDGAAANLKSFDHLCRSSAVGCEAFTDTQGTSTPFASYRNAVCSINGAADASNARECLWHGKAVCSVLPNETNCRFNFDGGANQLAASGNYTYTAAADTFIIPADTTVYLIDDGSKTCDVAEVGCTALGDNDLNTMGTCKLAGAATVNARACSVDGAVACFVAPGQTSCSYRIPWKTNGKTVYKMINPDTIDNALCLEKAVSCQAWTTSSGQKSYFKDPGSALCEYRDKASINGRDVSGWFKKGKDEPCDPTFVIAAKELGIRKNLDTEFLPNAMAGVCKTEYAGCTEFTDHADTGIVLSNGRREFPSGRPFYYIKDKRVDDAVAYCKNLVSQKQGCLALDQTENPLKTIDTAATYAASELKAYAAVAPVSTAANDANIVMKVTRDRVCSEWMECSTEQIATDGSTGRDINRCLGLGSCLEKGKDGRCIKWGSLKDGYPTLSVSEYASRDVTSAGNDYSGFSVPGLPPVFAFKQTPSVPFTLNVNGKQEQQTCKAYPETDSPFSKLGAPTGANICENSGTGKDCECSYRKVSYGAMVKYYDPTAEVGMTKDFTAGDIAPAICTSGPYEGQGCSVYASGDRVGSYPSGSNLSCARGNDEGTCTAVGKIDSFVGMNGYCLEYDKTIKASGGNKPVCLTWLPIDQPNGRDSNNLFASAGFLPKPGQEMYCAAPLKVCVPNECANNAHTSSTFEDMIPPICTQLQQAEISFTTNGVNYTLPDGCFNACYLGDENNGAANSSCAGQETNKCGGYLRTFCDAIGYNRSRVATAQELPGMVATRCLTKINQLPECVKYVATDTKQSYCKDSYDYCIDYMTPRFKFCNDLGATNCFNNYGGQFTCGEDLQDSGLAITSTFCGRNTLHSPYPSCVGRASGVNCHDPSYQFNYNDLYDATIVNGVDNNAKTISSCDSIGKISDGKFCGNGEACPVGESCVPVNDLTARQSEYTEQEAKDVTLIDTTWENNTLPKDSGSVIYPIALNYQMNSAAVGASRKVAVYNTIPQDGAHTYLSTTGLGGFPTLSSDVLEFRPSSDPEAVNGDWMSYQGHAIQNASMETKNMSPTIGSYPIDLVGMFYLGKKDESGSMSVDYDMVSPSLIFANQVSRITMRLISYRRGGWCRYGFTQKGGSCFEYDDNNGQNTTVANPPIAYPYKWISYKPSDHTFGNLTNGDGSYGYWIRDTDDWQINNSSICTDPDESKCKTTDIGPTDLVMTSGNGWRAQASSSEGSVKVALRLSTTEPKRVIGIRIEATDMTQGGYFYLSNVDFKLAGPVKGAACGEVVYAGSSNPLAKDNTASGGSYGVARTDALVSSTLSANDSSGGQIRKGDQCSPWGAFSIANPATIVTMATGKCEISKGAIFNGAAEILKVFAKALGVGIFNDKRGTNPNGYTENYFSYIAASLPAQLNLFPARSNTPLPGAQPTFGTATLNEQTSGLIAGAGSLRVDYKFYAEANANQLPLKGVEINWGDGERYSSGRDNFYKNHKVACGLTTDSVDNCEAKPFSYSHVYSCVQANNTAPYDINEIGVRQNDPVCIFHPSVNIIDNWGNSATSGNNAVGVILPVQE